MNKNFPLVLFPCLNDELHEEEYLSTMHKNAENLLKLNLNQPLDANIDETKNEIKCYTHKYYSNSIFNKTSPILPWNLPRNCISNDGKQSTANL